MSTSIYSIGGKRFAFSLTLEQDELLAPITRRMLDECPAALTGATKSLMDASREGTDRSVAEDRLLTMTLDLIRVNAWIYENRLGREILAILLVPDGGEFSEADLPSRREFMAKHATRDVATEVINHFFIRSGIFGIASATSSPAMPSPTTL